MRSILADWPYQALTHRLDFGPGRQATIRAQQPVVWVALAPFSAKAVDPDQHAFLPFVIDTGYGGRMLLNFRHLQSWSSLTLNQLARDPSGEIVYGAARPRYKLSAWLLPHDPRKDIRLAYSEAFRITVASGATVITADTTEPWRRRPELPLLGMQLFDDNRLRVTIDAAQHQINVETARRW